MKTRRYMPSYCEFGDLKLGDVFKDSSGTYYMKVQEVGHQPTTMYNTVNIECGTRSFTSARQEVIRVYGYFQEEYK